MNKQSVFIIIFLSVVVTETINHNLPKILFGVGVKPNETNSVVPFSCLNFRFFFLSVEKKRESQRSMPANMGFVCSLFNCFFFSNTGFEACGRDQRTIAGFRVM